MEAEHEEMNSALVRHLYLHLCVCDYDHADEFMLCVLTATRVASDASRLAKSFLRSRVRAHSIVLFVICQVAWCNRTATRGRLTRCGLLSR